MKKKNRHEVIVEVEGQLLDRMLANLDFPEGCIAENLIAGEVICDRVQVEDDILTIERKIVLRFLLEDT